MANNFRVKDLYADNIVATGYGISFNYRPTVNGTGVLLSGEGSSTITNVVYTTGDQNISGDKRFYNTTYFGNSNYYITGNNDLRIGSTGSNILINSSGVKITGDFNSIGLFSIVNEIGSSASENYFGAIASLNEFGNSANINRFGESAAITNEIGLNAILNDIGNGAANNIFGSNNTVLNEFASDSFENTFGNNAAGFNSFGQSSTYNIFGPSAGSNEFGNSATINTFGNIAPLNEFGKDAYENGFGNNVSGGGNTFGFNAVGGNLIGVNADTNEFGTDAGSNYFGNNAINNYYYSGSGVGQFNFDTRPRVNGTGVLLSGEGGGTINNVVYTTGNQNISGIKTFVTGVNVQSITIDSDTILTRKAEASLRLGAADTAISSAVVTANFTTDLITWPSHGLKSGCAISFSNSGGALFGGLTAQSLYYVTSISANTFKVAVNYVSAMSTSPAVIDLTSNGSGINTAKATQTYQSLNVQNYTGTNVVGAPLVINASQGAGLGGGGQIIFRTAPAGGASGSTQNALFDTFTIDNSSLTLRGNSTSQGVRVYTVGDLLVTTRALGGSQIYLDSQNRNLYSNDTLNIGNGLGLRVDGQAVLRGDAGNILAQRNSASPQINRLYNTFVARGAGTTNLEALETKAQTSGSFIIQSLRGSLSGTARDIEFRHGAIDTNGVITNGSLIATITNTGLSLANPLTIANGGTNATTASAARTNLGLGTTDSPTFAALTATSTIRAGGYTVATLPSGSVGMRCYVSDANATTFYSTVSSGGANIVPVFYNGANWVIA